MDTFFDVLCSDFKVGHLPFKPLFDEGYSPWRPGLNRVEVAPFEENDSLDNQQSDSSCSKMS